jgi:hypothetical protein
MGAWSDYPDGNDAVADKLSIFIQRYFMMLANDAEFARELKFKEEDNYYPGLDCSLGLRTGGAPIFNKDDLSVRSMKIYLKLFTFYSLHVDSFTLVGLAVGMSRIINNEPYGIFVDEAKDIPQRKCPFGPEIKSIIHREIEGADLKEKCYEKILNYFS